MLFEVCNSTCKVLRLVGGDTKPAMPYIYETMDKAKEQIPTNSKNQDSQIEKGVENN